VVDILLFHMAGDSLPYIMRTNLKTLAFRTRQHLDKLRIVGEE